MKKAIMLVLTVALLGSIAPLSGAEWWEKKRYTEWSEKDVRKMLNDSPWTQDFEEKEAEIEPVPSPSLSPGPPASPGGAGAPPTDDSGGGPGDEQALARTAYHFQIRSALPIRQALVRRAQLQQDYARMPAEQKQTFDRTAEEFLAEEFSERVVIFVTCESNTDSDLRELKRHWLAQTTETLKESVFLIGSKGRKAELQGFALVGESGQAFELTFPRRVEDAELVGPDDKSLQLEFMHPGIRGKDSRRVRVEFKPKKMQVNGQPVY